ncbi:RNA polymerase sigma-70 factor (ECF subfamily) [Caulobacter ginsengisoli]|uniref:RNA polymerase sigma-70 factor (ECF subfamily) n=1 Tax=Caulobacter ginsengisoli TaxID=400775 RepID=A0ABU0ISA4_9CAUL|nr:sigma-70 family RNA polymerase sigma factor [Caulobacter ginsengisoli]MDQ0464869.1 RNA polymerase sigma-70 factor (ECF subfamily) [Caulobacter ginsengisoli]
MNRDLEHVLDEYLVLQCRAGSRAAMGQLVGRWTPRLLRHASRTLNSPDAAADVVQDAWISALRGLGRLDDPARFPAWLYAIATRKCVDHIRKAARGRRLAAGLAAQPPPAAPSGSDLKLDFAAALARLPADQRLVASLFYGEDLSLEEVAAVAGVPLGTVKSRLHHARQSLKLVLEGA